MMPPLLTQLSKLVAGKRSRSERRGARRLSPGQLTPCQITSADESEPRSAWVHNLSLRGVGMLTDRSYEPGVRLRVLLVNSAHTFALSAEMHVARCYRVVNGDYFVGCQFIRQLAHHELMPFMV